MPDTVRDFMISGVETLGPDDSMEAAVLLERRRGIRHIPIVDQGALVGIVTDRDLKRAMPSLLTGTDQETYQRITASTKIRQIMTRSPMTIAPDAPLKDAVRILYEQKFGALPVVDAAGQLVGIITETDLLRAFLNLLDGVS